MPANLTLEQLHDVLQLAMGWEDCHMHDFRIGQKRFGKPRGDWQLMLFLLIVVLRIAYIYLGRGVHGQRPSFRAWSMS